MNRGMHVSFEKSACLVGSNASASGARGTAGEIAPDETDSTADLTEIRQGPATALTAIRRATP
jgi:hypothetical protein